MFSTSAALMYYSAQLHSPTYNEPAHLVAGLADWNDGSFDLYTVNTPLVRMTAAAPVVRDNRMVWGNYSRDPGDRAVFSLAQRLVNIEKTGIHRLIFRARCACFPFFLLGGMAACLWAAEIWQSRVSGLLAAFLWLFEPFLLGNGELITSDCAAASLGLFAGYAFWRWHRGSDWLHTIGFGIALGLAIAAKLIWLPACLIFAVISLLCPARGSSSACTGLLKLCVAMLIGIVVLNAAYGFTGTMRQLKDFDFQSQLFRGDSDEDNRFRASFAGQLPVLIPAPCLSGIDVQLRDFEESDRSTFAAGKWYSHGVWWYYLYGLCVKTSHAHQLLFVLSLGALMIGRLRRASAVPVLGPAFAIILLTGCMNGMTTHYRYLLPAYGFLIVFSSGIGSLHQSRGIAVAVLAVCVSLVISLSRAYPNHLSYFNEMAGGVGGDNQQMLHSCNDWGQDLLLLDRYARSRQLQIHFFGQFSLDPQIVLRPPSPITHRSPFNSEDLPPGLYAFERTLYSEMCRDGLLADLRARGQMLTHIADVGGSILLYRLTESAAQAQGTAGPATPSAADQ